MITDIERALEVHDGIARFGFILKFKGDDHWYSYTTLPYYPYQTDLVGVFDTPQEAFGAMGEKERSRGYDIRRDAPDEFLR